MRRNATSIRAKAKAIKLLLLDVDGVLTDGGIVIDDHGIETKRFDVRDGQGIALLLAAGIDVGFITARKSEIVRRRARELGVKHVYQGVKDKAEVYHRIKRQTHLQDHQIAYVGDDLGDLRVLQQAGFSATVSNAGPPLSGITNYVTRAKGGYGAVREISELLLKAQNLWKSVVQHYLK